MDNYNNSEYDTLEINEEKYESDTESFITCERTIHQKAKVSLPIAIEPFVVSGKIKARCCSDPKVSIDCMDNCSYVITQEICVEIPLKFGVSTEVSKECIECERPYIEEACHE